MVWLGLGFTQNIHILNTQIKPPLSLSLSKPYKLKINKHTLILFLNYVLLVKRYRWGFNLCPGFGAIIC